MAPDGRSIELRYLRAHPKDASWGLSEPTTFVPEGSLLGGPIVHLAWSPTQTSDLAIIDAVGRVLIVNFSTNVNRPTTQRRWDEDSTDDLNAVVGTFWLNILPTHRNQVFELHSQEIYNEVRLTSHRQILYMLLPTRRAIVTAIPLIHPCKSATRHIIPTLPGQLWSVSLPMAC